jgi:hypothetical protein
MKRFTMKMTLNRETIGILQRSDLKKVAGGSGDVTCWNQIQNTDCPCTTNSFCNC